MLLCLEKLTGKIPLEDFLIWYLRDDNAVNIRAIAKKRNLTKVLEACKKLGFS